MTDEPSECGTFWMLQSSFWTYWMTVPYWDPVFGRLTWFRVTIDLNSGLLPQMVWAPGNQELIPSGDHRHTNSREVCQIFWFPSTTNGKHGHHPCGPRLVDSPPQETWSYDHQIPFLQHVLHCVRGPEFVGTGVNHQNLSWLLIGCQHFDRHRLDYLLRRSCVLFGSWLRALLDCLSQYTRHISSGDYNWVTVFEVAMMLWIWPSERMERRNVPTHPINWDQFHSRFLCYTFKFNLLLWAASPKAI
jgi:hypothetical protein